MIRTAAAAAAIALATPAIAQEPRVRVELELGGSIASRNDVAIPGNTGTRFDLNALQGEPTSPLVRATLDWQAWDRHGFRFAYQYLRNEGSGTLPGPTLFRDVVFAPGPARGRYRFDTWRATYRYKLFQGEETRFYIGATALVRDAEIELSQAGVTRRRSDLGLVPLLHLAAEWRPTPGLRLMAEIDGLAAPQGYAIDAAVRGALALGQGWEATLSYRVLDGGADNSSVYTFATFHSVTAGIAYRF